MKEKNYKGIIENVVELASNKLNEWENDFIESIQIQIYPLTENQKKIILKIQDKYLKHE